MTNDVDLVVLSRDGGELRPEVQAAISRQKGVNIQLHRVIGHARPDDPCRWESIARARNEGRQRGSSPWLMFVDDDVVLSDNTVSVLLDELRKRPRYAALAADYLDEAQRTRTTGHIAMGATLFRRAALDRITFRWDRNRCECQCCCDDLRRLGFAIAYCPRANAQHLESDDTLRHYESSEAESSDGVVLAAFDQGHFQPFRDQFLRSLRQCGNNHRVIVVGYGLRHQQRKQLNQFPNVELRDYAAFHRGDGPPRRRLRDFQDVVSDLDDLTPVAYWDAGDVVIQGDLNALWETARMHPDKLLAVREPFSHPDNTIVAKWTLSIHNPAARRKAFDLLTKRPVLNSGFAAGTAKSVGKYLSKADHLLHSPAMEGTTDWGDQTALNLYCHSQPDAWHEIEEGWNYCLCGRDRREVFVLENGRIASRKGTPIHAVHGNARTLWNLRGYHHVTRMLNSGRSHTAMNVGVQSLG